MNSQNQNVRIDINKLTKEQREASINLLFEDVKKAVEANEPVVIGLKNQTFLNGNPMDLSAAVGVVIVNIYNSVKEAGGEQAAKKYCYALIMAVKQELDL